MVLFISTKVCFYLYQLKYVGKYLNCTYATKIIAITVIVHICIQIVCIIIQFNIYYKSI